MYKNCGGVTWRGKTRPSPHLERQYNIKIRNIFIYMFYILHFYMIKPVVQMYVQGSFDGRCYWQFYDNHAQRYATTEI
jgi:hypothetical protein